MSFFVRVKRRGGYLALAEGPFEDRVRARAVMYARVELEPVGVRHDTLSEMFVVEKGEERVLEDYSWQDLAPPEARNRKWGFVRRVWDAFEEDPGAAARKVER